MKNPAEMRPDKSSSENENLRPGSPPRPATEPKGAEHSTKNSKTATDPGSGEPNRERDSA
jgi:hypothetical protein